MKTVHKFPLEVTDEQYVSMPSGAETLCVQMQSDVPCLWAKVDTERPTYRRRIKMRGTGHPFDGREDRYIGTFQIGPLVFHTFEEG